MRAVVAALFHKSFLSFCLALFVVMAVYLCLFVVVLLVSAIQANNNHSFEAVELRFSILHSIGQIPCGRYMQVVSDSDCFTVLCNLFRGYLFSCTTFLVLFMFNSKTQHYILFHLYPTCSIFVPFCRQREQEVLSKGATATAGRKETRRFCDTLPASVRAVFILFLFSIHFGLVLFF